MSNNALNPDKIKIVSFTIIKGEIENPFDFDNSLINGYTFDVNYDVGFNLEDKLAKTDFQVEVTTQSKKNQEEVRGYFHFSFLFMVENLEELISVSKKVKETEIDANLGNALASITYSTSRGILMTRFQGTSLKEFILPVIDPNNLLKTT